jgi:hypothetical protein
MSYFSFLFFQRIGDRMTEQVLPWWGWGLVSMLGEMTGKVGRRVNTVQKHMYTYM